MDRIIKPVVLHVSTPLTWRGGEQQLFYLFETLQLAGISQHLLCPKGAVSFAKASTAGWQVHAYSKQSGFDIRAALSLKKLSKKIGVNVIHAHDAHAHTMCILATLLGMQIPIVLHRRVDFPIKRKWFTQFKYNHPSIKRIICVSDAVKAIVDNGTSAPHKTITIHSGIHLKTVEVNNDAGLSLRKELHLSADTPLIGNVSALADHKDYPTFLKVAQVLKSMGKPYHFVIIGDGELKAELMDLCRTMDLNDVVHFIGFRAEAKQLMRALNCFLFTSKTEGLGTTVLDAMAREIPVVATDGGGISEMMIDHKTGLLCKVGDIESLSKAVISVIDQPILKEQLIKGASEHLKQFSVDKMAEDTLQLYKDVLQEK